MFLGPGGVCRCQQLRHTRIHNLTGPSPPSTHADIKDPRSQVESVTVLGITHLGHPSLNPIEVAQREGCPF